MSTYAPAIRLPLLRPQIAARLPLGFWRGAYGERERGVLEAIDRGDGSLAAFHKQAAVRLYAKAYLFTPLQDR